MATDAAHVADIRAVVSDAELDKSKLSNRDEAESDAAGIGAHAKAEERQVHQADTGSSESNGALVSSSRKEVRSSAAAWASTLVHEMPKPTKREYEVLHDGCGVYSEPRIHQSRLLGSMSLGDRVFGCQITVNGWLKLDSQEGWMATDIRCLNEDEEKEGELMRPVIPAGDAVQDLAISNFHPQGICCLEIVFQQVVIRRWPHRKALPLGVCRRGEFVFTSNQTFDGWVRLIAPEGWMLVHADEHGDLLKPRLPFDVSDIDVCALCEIWMTVRRSNAQPLPEEIVDSLKDLERRASRVAAEMVSESEHAIETENQLSFNKRRRSFFVNAAMEYLREEEQWIGIWQGTIEHHGTRCVVSHDNVVYECSTGEAIGVWDSETSQVIEVPIVQVDGRPCLIAEDCAVYDLVTREHLGAFNHETRTVEFTDEAEAETLDEAVESSDPLSASISDEVDAGTGGMPTNSEDTCASLDSDHTDDETTVGAARRPDRDMRNGEVFGTISSALHLTQSPPLDAPRVFIEHPPRPENLCCERFKVEQALRLAEECDTVEKAMSNPDRIWHEVLELRPLLLQVVQSEFELPRHFQNMTDACVACLPYVSDAPIRCVGQVAELLSMPDLSQVLHYFTWLESALAEARTIGNSSCRTSPDLKHMKDVLLSWPTECALYQRKATSVWEAVRKHGPDFLSNTKDREDWKDSHASVGKLMGKQMHEELRSLAANLSTELQENQGLDWKSQAEKTQATLKKVQQLTIKFLERDKSKENSREAEDFRIRADVQDVAVLRARQEVRHYLQAFRQAAARFIDSGEQVVAWASVVIPKLHVLGQHTKALRTCADLQKRLFELEAEKIAAEDDLDVAVMELRRYRRRMCGSRASCSIKMLAKDVEVATMVESRLELDKRCIAGHVRQLEMALRDAEAGLQAAAQELPIAVEIVGLAGAVLKVAREPEAVEVDAPSIAPL